jgi:cobalt-zinc-cadmium efflux system membrane fusion protein
MMKRLVRAVLLVSLGAIIACAGMVLIGPDRLSGWAYTRISGPSRTDFRSLERRQDFVPAKGSPTSADWVDDGWCSASGRTREPGSSGLRGAHEAGPCRRLLPIVRLSSNETAGRIGLEAGTAAGRLHGHRLSANAEIDYAAHNYAEVRPRVAGLIREVRADEGQKVRKGDVLLVVDSAEVGSAKAHYLTALPAVEMAKENNDIGRALVKQQIVGAKREIEGRTAWNRARADLLDAEQRLHNLGFSESDLRQIARTEDTTSLLSVVAPSDGTLVERFAVVGVAVEPTTALFVDVDISIMWVWIDVYETEVAEVAPGQAVSFTISGTDAPVFSGHVELIGASVNPATRTVRVRAELANPGGKLRAKQFGRAEIQVGAEHETVFVPRAAVQNDGEDDLVFCPLADGGFRPQRVKTRPAETSAEVEIEWGLKPGQRVVTTGAFLLKSEMLKAILGEKVFGGEG